MAATITMEKPERAEKQSNEALILPMLEIKNITISLRSGHKRKKREVVRNLSFSISPGEIVGLAGESGSGKSLTALAILGLLPPALEVTEGEILFQGRNLQALSEKEKHRLRGKDIGYVFQHYQSSFTPFLKIGKQLVEALRSHEKISKRKAAEKALLWLEKVKLPAEKVFESYPHELSGGQLQRAALAATLILEPKLLIADEPTTALDVLTGESILEILADMQIMLGSSVLLISHNLNHLLSKTDSLAVMYGGQLAEKGVTQKVKQHPQHPYTKLLLNTRLVLQKTMPAVLPVIPEEAGSARTGDKGCSFQHRCPLANNQCMEVPAIKPAGPFHWVACHAAKQEKIHA